MSNFHKFGLVTMVGWNVMLIVLIQINSAIKQVPLTYIFNDETGGIGISIFFFICQFFGVVLAINQGKITC